MTRGEVYWTSLYKDFGTSIQGGYRPVVVISSLVGCNSSDVVMIVPLSTKIKLHSCNAQLDFRLNDDVPQMAICSQIRTVSKERLSNFSGTLSVTDMEKIETAILISMGIAKPSVDRIKLSQEALAQQKKDREALENLIPQAKGIITQITDILKRQDIKRLTTKDVKVSRVRRSEQDIQEFMKEFSDPYNNRHEVAKAFGFSNYASAYNFYWNRLKKEKKENGIKSES